MPGLFGKISYDSNYSFNSLKDKMTSIMNHNNHFRIDVYKNKNLMCGRVSLGILNNVAQPVKDEQNNNWIIFHGELYNNPTSQSDPEYILRSYKKKKDNIFNDLNGIFHLAIFDSQANQLKLCGDKFGLLPLYYSLQSNGFIFAAEVKGILQDDQFDKEIDYQSLADFFHYGQILGNKTLLKNIKMIQAGTILTYDLNKRNIIEKRYWHLDSLFMRKGDGNHKTTTEEVVSSLIHSIEQRATLKNNLGISLSGGLDSRGILAGLKDNAKGIYSYTLGLPDCADQKLAKQMADVAQTRHEFIEIRNSYLDDFKSIADGMIWFSDGMYHPHESTEMLALDYFKRAPFKVLLRGHGGEIAKAALAYPVMAKPEVYSFTNGQQIFDYIFNITNLVLKDIDPEKLFTPFFFNETKEGARSSLKESIQHISNDLSPADVCIYYYINEHIRRQVTASLDIFRTEIEVRMPYIDENFVRLLLQLDVGHRNTGEIHYELIKKCVPRLVKIPNSNTGAPLDASFLRLFITDKFNSVMKRFSVVGFRHYTEFQDWYRKSFKQLINSIFFNESSFVNTIFDENYLKKIVNEHITKSKNYAHLLGTAVGIELWYKKFIE